MFTQRWITHLQHFFDIVNYILQVTVAHHENFSPIKALHDVDHHVEGVFFVEFGEEDAGYEVHRLDVAIFFIV